MFYAKILSVTIDSPVGSLCISQPIGSFQDLDQFGQTGDFATKCTETTVVWMAAAAAATCSPHNHGCLAPPPRPHPGRTPPAPPLTRTNTPRTCRSLSHLPCP